MGWSVLADVICLCIDSQALDGDFSDENRERCRVATTPLIEAVDNLSTFASNPEFASIPAQISHEVMKYWIPQYFMYYLLCMCECACLGTHFTDFFCAKFWLLNQMQEDRQI